MAEATGFEPANELPRYTLSKRAPSTTRPHFRFNYLNTFLCYFKDKIMRFSICGVRGKKLKVLMFSI